MFSQRIKEMRLARNMSQVELARLLGVTKQSVSNWENGNIQPSIDMLEKLARALSVSSDWLLDLDDRVFIEADGLSAEETAHIQQVINDIKKKK